MISIWLKLPLLFETSMHAASHTCCITSYLSATDCCEMYDGLALTSSTAFKHLDTTIAFNLVQKLFAFGVVIITALPSGGGGA